MHDDEDLSDDDLIDDSEDTDFEDGKIDIKQGDSRRKLEDYLERKRLEKEFEYY